MSLVITQWIGSPTSIVVHTILFITIFGLHFFGVTFDQIMLILTTAVSLEAIYLALFIQMTVNRHSESLEDVEEDLDEIQHDVETVQTTVEGLEDEVDEISADIDDIQADEEEEVTQEQKINNTILTLTEEIKKLQKEISDLKKS